MIFGTFEGDLDVNRRNAMHLVLEERSTMSQVLSEQSGDDCFTAKLGLEDIFHNVNEVDAQRLWASFLGSLDTFDEHLED